MKTFVKYLNGSGASMDCTQNAVDQTWITITEYSTLAEFAAANPELAGSSHMREGYKYLFAMLGERIWSSVTYAAPLTKAAFVRFMEMLDIAGVSMPFSQETVDTIRDVLVKYRTYHTYAEDMRPRPAMRRPFAHLFAAASRDLVEIGPCRNVEETRKAIDNAIALQKRAADVATASKSAGLEDWCAY